jgi:nitrous oxidase accessory protein NosD
MVDALKLKITDNSLCNVAGNYLFIFNPKLDNITNTSSTPNLSPVLVWWNRELQTCCRAVLWSDDELTFCTAPSICAFISETIATSDVSSVYYSNYTDMVDALKLKITDNSLCNVAGNYIFIFNPKHLTVFYNSLQQIPVMNTVHLY